MQEKSLREFLYLDATITRSLLAQMEEGVVEQLSRSKEARQRLNGAIKGDVPLLASGEVGGESEWGQSEAEVRTLQDYLFNLVEAALRKRASFLDLSADTATARDRCQQLFAGEAGIGRFLLVRGRILLKDYSFLTSLIENYHPVAEAVSKLSAATEKREGTLTKRQVRLLEQATPAFSKDSAKQIREVLAWLHGDRLVLQVRPGWDLTKAFETDLEEQWLRFSRGTLRFRYGVRFQGEWNLLCQVASVPSAESALPSIPELDPLKQALDTLFENLRGWIAYTHITAPVVSVVPIAVYRDLV